MWGDFLFDRPGRRAPVWAKIAVWLLLSVALSFACYAVLAGSARSWGPVWKYREAFWRGWLLTLEISAIALVASTLVGVLLATCRRSAFLPLRNLATIVVEVLRGTPLLVQIAFVWYVLFEHSSLDRVIVGTLTLSVFSGAYISEMIRSGIESVGRSQIDSARAIGLTRWQIYRHVIGPQSLRQVLPPLAGQFASLIKDSSLLSVIGIGEFTFVALQVNSATYRTLEALALLAPGYLILTLPISLLSRALEARSRYET